VDRHVDDRDLRSVPTRRSSDLAGVVTGQWNHMEVFVDLKQKVATASVNGKELHTVDLTGVVFNANSYSPTIALLGFNGSHMDYRSEEHTSELQSRENLVCRLLL